MTSTARCPLQTRFLKIEISLADLVCCSVFKPKFHLICNPAIIVMTLCLIMIHLRYRSLTRSRGSKITLNQRGSVSVHSPWLALAVTHIQSERNSSDITKRYVSEVNSLCLIGAVVALELQEVHRIQKPVIDIGWSGINKDLIAAFFNVMSAFVSMTSKSPKMSQNIVVLCVISGFRHGVNEICALLGFYTAQNSGLLPTFWGQP